MDQLVTILDSSLTKADHPSVRHPASPLAAPSAPMNQHAVWPVFGMARGGLWPVWLDMAREAWLVTAMGVLRHACWRRGQLMFILFNTEPPARKKRDSCSLSAGREPARRDILYSALDVHADW